MTAVAEINVTGSRRIVVGLLPFGQGPSGFVPATGTPRDGVGSGAQNPAQTMTRSLPGALRSAARSDRLTSRERQVVDRICEGLSNKQIATRLGIAIHTVKCHVHNILAKLEVDNRVQIAVFGRSGERAVWGPELVQG